MAALDDPPFGDQPLGFLPGGEAVVEGVAGEPAAGDGGDDGRLVDEGGPGHVQEQRTRLHRS